MDKYKLRVKRGEEPPEEWSRVLVPFADGGLEIVETFTMECIINVSPLTLERMEPALKHYVDFIEYDGTHTSRGTILDDNTSTYNWWKT